MRKAKRFLFSISLAIAGVLFQQCSDDPAPRVNQVYLAGSHYTSGPNEASYYLNGELTALELSDGENSGVYTMINAGKDIYAGGFSDNYAAYWKNGKLTKLARVPNSESEYVVSMAVSGNDIHLAVSTTNGMYYWKNGVYTQLCTNCEFAWTGNVIAVSKGDVYISGTRNDGTSHAGYWKNGVWTAVHEANVSSLAKGIRVVGSDVYVAGGYYISETGAWVPCYWKNTTVTALSELGGLVYDLEVVKDKVYAAGYLYYPNSDESHAVLWSNGVESQIGKSASADYGYSIRVRNGDVYMSGEMYDNAKGWLPLLWKNGDLQAPFAGTEAATGWYYALLVK